MKRLLVLLVVAWLAGPPASHAQSPEAVKALADLVVDDADKREAAIAVIGGTRDPKWLEFLAALRDGNVYARGKSKDAEVVVGGAKTTKGDAEVIEIASAYDRKPLGAVPLAGLIEIAADRRLRIAIKPFLDADETRLQLESPDPEARRGAAVKLGHQAAAGAAPVVEAAIKKEPVPAVRHALEEALALIRLAHGDAAVRDSGRPVARGAALLRRRARAAEARGRYRGLARGAGRRPGRHPPDRALGPPGPDGRDRVPGRLARVDPPADGPGAGHRVRPDGRHQHGPRRADGAGRLQHVRRPERLPRALAPALRRLLRGRAARVVRGGGAGRRRAGARRHPPAVRPAAGDAPADLGRLPHHPAGAAPVLRRRQRGRLLADVAVGRLRAHDRAHGCRSTGSSSSAWPP